MPWIRERIGLAALGVGALAFGACQWFGRPLSQPPGVLAPEAPRQDPPESPQPWMFQGHTLVPLARFEVRARVLGAERYRFDRAAELSPVDLALGWGSMSDSRVLDAFSIQQRDRWYFWSSSSLPVPPAEVIAHSANMHMIPSDGLLARRLKAVRPGQLVQIQGQLVRVEGPDGWCWVSSLSRADAGDGSCEVVWVETLRVADRLDRM